MIASAIAGEQHQLGEGWAEEVAIRAMIAFADELPSSGQSDALALAEEYAAKGDWNGAYHAMRCAMFATDRHAEGRIAGLEEAAKDLHNRADKLDPPGGKRVPMVDQHTASVMRAAATRFYNLAHGEAS